MFYLSPARCRLLSVWERAPRVGNSLAARSFAARILVAAGRVVFVWGFLASTLLWILPITDAHAQWIQRRRPQFEAEDGRFIYPIVAQVPGIGAGAGGGFTLLDVGGYNADVGGVYLTGDFTVAIGGIFNLEAIEENLFFDLGVGEIQLITRGYERGLDSSPEVYSDLDLNLNLRYAGAKLSFSERRYEFRLAQSWTRSRLVSLVDQDGNRFDFDQDWTQARGGTLGFILDYTDDRQDPRRGLRIEIEEDIAYRWDEESDFSTFNRNYSVYLPFGGNDTLILNHYRSSARRVRQLTFDRADEEKAVAGQCEGISSAEAESCNIEQKRFLDQQEATARFGTATPLGGTQRLRAYPQGRFYAGETSFYGLEYRLNLTEERSLFDYLLLRGVRTNYQIAFFFEEGSVAERPEDLFEDSRQSYGVGFRLVLTGLIVRLDLGSGSEGTQWQFFVEYPLSLLTVNAGP